MSTETFLRQLIRYSLFTSLTPRLMKQRVVQTRSSVAQFSVLRCQAHRRIARLGDDSDAPLLSYNSSDDLCRVRSLLATQGHQCRRMRKDGVLQLFRAARSAAKSSVKLPLIHRSSLVPQWADIELGSRY